MAFTPISELGEFGLIDKLTKGFPSKHADMLAKGIGDDAAIIRLGEEQALAVSTDMLVEGVHFDLAYVPLRHLGYKAVAVNLSDIFAMNAIPYGVTVSIAMSSRFTVEAMEELYEGVKLACDHWNVDLIGGDTTGSPQGLSISVTALGQAREDEIVYRSGAKPNDLVCVSGDIGSAYAGFLILDREKEAFLKNPEMQPDLTDFDYVIGRQLKPEPRGDVIQSLREKKVQPTSMMDISDGLAGELLHICKASGTGVVIYMNKLPIDYQTIKVAEEFSIGPGTFALNGGEDYELVFTVPLEAYNLIKDLPELHIIGKITDDINQKEVILESGASTQLEAQGWKHF
ncbi:MAG: thiamine-phosphate kinase [Bacteroidia bacterium]